MIHRLKKARKAYKKKDPKKSEEAHTPEEIKKHIHHHEEEKGSGEYIGSAVYGAIDGIVTTFAIVSGVVGAQLSSGVILILGFANLLADGFSMAAGQYLSTKSERDYIDQEYAREIWETEKFPEGEIAEIREIYRKKGFKDKDLERAVEIITGDKKVWVDTMMMEELGLQLKTKNPIIAGTVTFIAFILAGFMPLITYILTYFYPQILPKAFIMTIILTAITLFIVGSLRTLVTGKNWIQNGIEMLLVGGLASGVAYYIGYLLRSLA
jgi:vacuolar iron transporter family protein